MPTKRTDFFQLALDRVRYEHEQLSEQWRQLDSKAQSTATIAGIFMAGAFAFLQSSSVQLTVGQKFLFFLVISALVLSIAFAVGSMLVESIPMPPTSGKMSEMLGDILQKPESELDERYDGLLSDTINPWIAVNSSLLHKIEGKGGKIKVSQEALLAAAAGLALLTLLVLFCPPATK